MRLNLLLALFLLASLPIGASAAQKEPKVTIEAIRIQLFYENTGKLSDNLSPPAKFSGWNTIIGEGDAKEPATDILASVILSADQKDKTAPYPLTIIARNNKGKVLAERTWKDLLFIEKKLIKALFVPNAGCAERLNIEARFGDQTKTTGIKLACGE